MTPEQILLQNAIAIRQVCFERLDEILVSSEERYYLKKLCEAENIINEYICKLQDQVIG